MTPMGLFESYYNGTWQHPVLLWVSAATGLLLVWLRTGLAPSTRWFCTLLAFVSILDAWLTSEPVPGIGPLTGAWASGVPLTFVLLGDYRLFAWLESNTPQGAMRFTPKTLLRAVGWTLLVPVLSKPVLDFLSPVPLESRVLWLVYEVEFALLVGVLLWRYVPRACAAAAWARPVCWYAISYYSLWALSDAIILAGFDVGFLLRVVPNLMYYGGLFAFIAWTAPRRGLGYTESSNVPSSGRPRSM